MFLNCGYVNIQSVGNKTIEIRELLNKKTFDIFAITETWLTNFDTAKISEMTPSTHSFLHSPREDRRGGGVGLFVSRAFTRLRLCQSEKMISFEHQEISFRHNSQSFLFVVIYRPPSTPVNLFIDEFGILLDRLDRVSQNAFIVGDFNIWMDDLGSYEAKMLCELLDTHQLVNNVRSLTTATGHMLDLVISHDLNHLIREMEVEENCTISPVHKLITFKINIPKSKVIKKITFRNKTDFSPVLFIDELSRKFENESNLQCTHNNLRQVRECIECLDNLYNSLIKREYEHYCPYIEKNIVVKDKSPWSMEKY